MISLSISLTSFIHRKRFLCYCFYVYFYLELFFSYLQEKLNNTICKKSITFNLLVSLRFLFFNDLVKIIKQFSKHEQLGFFRNYKNKKPLIKSLGMGLFITCVTQILEILLPTITTINIFAMNKSSNSGIRFQTNLHKNICLKFLSNLSISKKIIRTFFLMKTN